MISSNHSHKTKRVDGTRHRASLPLSVLKTIWTEKIISKIRIILANQQKSRAGSCQPELAKVNVNRPTTSSMPPRAEVVGWHQNTQKRPVNCSFEPSPSSSAAQECIKSETERRTVLIYHEIENAEKLLSEQSKDPRRRKIETNK